MAVSKFLVFIYLQRDGKWAYKTFNQSKNKIYAKCRIKLVRMVGIAQSTAVTFRRINQIVVGWINYYHIGIIKNPLMDLVNGFAIKSEPSF